MARGETPDTNIYIEASNNYRSLHNTDGLKDIFKIGAYTEISEGVLKIKDFMFVDINDQFLSMNRHYLLARCEIKEFSPRWINRPNYLSYDIYGTQAFAYILLFINDVISVMDFNFDYVRVPTIESISQLIINNSRLYPDRDIIKQIYFK